jgi:hypothetical protein
MTLKGGPELRARLQALTGTERKVYVDWKAAGVPAMRNVCPRNTGHASGSIRGVYGGEHRAAIVGDYWLIFVDRGTKAHDIRPKSVSGSGRGGRGTARALKFEYKGQTVFARKVHRRAMRRRPFITQAAREAARTALSAETIIGLWNRKSSRGRFSKVAG